MWIMFKILKKRVSGFLARNLMPPLEYATYLGVKIGKDCRIYNKNWGSEPFLITIGERVTVTSSVAYSEKVKQAIKLANLKKLSDGN